MLEQSPGPATMLSTQPSSSVVVGSGLTVVSAHPAGTKGHSQMSVVCGLTVVTTVLVAEQTLCPGKVVSRATMDFVVQLGHPHWLLITYRGTKCQLKSLVSFLYWRTYIDGSGASARSSQGERVRPWACGLASRAGPERREGLAHDVAVSSQGCRRNGGHGRGARLVVAWERAEKCRRRFR